MTEQIEKLAKDCEQAAQLYDRKPGYAGPGANASTISDLYRTIARLAKLIGDGETAKPLDDGQAATDK